MFGLHHSFYFHMLPLAFAYHKFGRNRPRKIMHIAGMISGGFGIILINFFILKNASSCQNIVFRNGHIYPIIAKIGIKFAICMKLMTIPSSFSGITHTCRFVNTDFRKPLTNQKIIVGKASSSKYFRQFCFEIDVECYTFVRFKRLAQWHPNNRFIIVVEVIGLNKLYFIGQIFSAKHLHRKNRN